MKEKNRWFTGTRYIAQRKAYKKARHRRTIERAFRSYFLGWSNGHEYMKGINGK